MKRKPLTKVSKLTKPAKGLRKNLFFVVIAVFAFIVTRPSAVLH